MHEQLFHALLSSRIGARESWKQSKERKGKSETEIESDSETTNPQCQWPLNVDYCFHDFRKQIRKWLFLVFGLWVTEKKKNGEVTLRGSWLFRTCLNGQSSPRKYPLGFAN